MENRENQRTVQLHLEMGFVPFDILIIELDEGGVLWRRRMGEGVLGIATVDAIAEVSREGKEETLDGLFDARGVG